MSQSSSSQTEWRTQTFITHDDAKLFYRYWHPPEAKKTLLILHGFGEHSGRYEKFSKYFKDSDFKIIALDLRGMGCSEGARGHLDSMDQVLEDIDCFYSEVINRFQISDDIYLLGHSFGGLVALLWSFSNCDKVKHLILSSPCLGLHYQGMIEFANRVLLKFNPNFVHKNPVKVHYLTHESHSLITRKNDPLIVQSMTAQFLRVMIEGIKKAISDQSKWRCDTTMTFLVSDCDRIVDSKKTHQFFCKLSLSNKEYKIFPNTYHEIFNETNEEEIFQFLLSKLV